MKANAPERLYLSENIYSTYLYQVPDPDDETAVEYTCTDAFVKKACDFIRKMVDIPHSIECKDGQPLVDDYIIYAEERLKIAEKVVEDFKNYMKGE